MPFLVIYLLTLKMFILISSHIHQNVTMQFLTCEPNFLKKDNYLDEADTFFANPVSWIRSHIPVYPKTALPSHVILFDNLQPKIKEFLSSYKQIHSSFHADVSDTINTI